MRESDPADRSPIRRAVDETTERLLEIVDDAFRIPEEAPTDRANGADATDTPASERLEAITRMADSLIERGGQVRHESDRLLDLLAERIRGLDRTVRTERRPRTRQPEPEPASDEATLHATKMAVTGASREEIADSLVEEFGLRNPRSIIESILGPRSGR